MIEASDQGRDVFTDFEGGLTMQLSLAGELVQVGQGGQGSSEKTATLFWPG